MFLGSITSMAVQFDTHCAYHWTFAWSVWTFFFFSVSSVSFIFRFCFHFIPRQTSSNQNRTFNAIRQWLNPFNSLSKWWLSGLPSGHIPRFWAGLVICASLDCRVDHRRSPSESVHVCVCLLGLVPLSLQLFCHRLTSLGRQPTSISLSLYDLVPYPAFFSSLSDSIFIHLSSSFFFLLSSFLSLFRLWYHSPKSGGGCTSKEEIPFFFLVLFTISFDLRHISSKIEASLSEQKNLLPFLGAVIHQLLATRESGNGQNKYFSLLSSILGGRVAKKKRAEGFNCWQKFAWWMRRSGCHRIIPRMNLAVGWWMNASRLLVITLFVFFSFA